MTHPNLKLAVQANLEGNIDKAVNLLRAAVDERCEDAVGLLAYLLDRHNDNPLCLEMWDEFTDKLCDEYEADGFAAYALSKFYQQKVRSPELIEEIQRLGAALDNPSCLYNSMLAAIGKDDEQSSSYIAENLERLQKLDPLLALEMQFLSEVSKGAQPETLDSLRNQALAMALADKDANCGMAIISLELLDELERVEVLHRLKEESDAGLRLSTTILAMVVVEDTDNQNDAETLERQRLLELGSAQGSQFCAGLLALDAYGQASDTDFDDEDLVDKFWQLLLDASVMNSEEAQATYVDMTEHAEHAYEFYRRLLVTDSELAPKAAETLRDRFADHPLTPSLDSDDFLSDLELWGMVTTSRDSTTDDEREVTDHSEQTSQFTDFLSSRKLALRFRGVYNSEGADCSLTSQQFANCDDSDLNHSCVACLRTPTNAVTIRSGYGDGTYAILDIIPEATNPFSEVEALGCLIIMDTDWTINMANEFAGLAGSDEWVEKFVSGHAVAEYTSLGDLDLGFLQDVETLFISDSGSNDGGGYALVSVPVTPGHYKISSFMAKSDEFGVKGMAIPMAMLALHESVYLTMIAPVVNISLTELNEQWANSNVFSSFTSTIDQALTINNDFDPDGDLSWAIQLKTETTEEATRSGLGEYLEIAYPKEFKESHKRALIRNYEASSLAKRGNFSQARKMLNEMISEHNGETGSPTAEGWAIAINTLAFSVEIPLGRFDTIRALLQRLIDAEVGYESLNAKSNLATLECLAGNLEIAEQLAQTVNMESPELREEALATLGDINLKRGNSAAAISYFESAWKETGDPDIAKHCYLQLRKLGKTDLRWQV